MNKQKKNEKPEEKKLISGCWISAKAYRNLMLIKQKAEQEAGSILSMTQFIESHFEKIEV
jgi:hypothetical protein